MHGSDSEEARVAVAVACSLVLRSCDENEGVVCRVSRPSFVEKTSWLW